MGRSPEEIEDNTPLAGARVDVAPRIGWLLRSARAAEGVNLRTMADRLAGLGEPLSAASLSRLETQGVRSGRMMDLYEQALELPHGWLRTPVEILCRTFSYAPPDTDPMRAAGDLTDFSASWDAVSGPAPTGSDWLRFVELQALGTHGLPVQLMTEPVERLVCELERSVYSGYTSRYVALQRLLLSEYADLTAAAMKAATEAPYAQAVSDLLNLLSETPRPDFVPWCAELVLHGHPAVFRAAAMALENARSAANMPDEVWLDFVPAFVTAYERAEPGSWPRRVLTTLYTTLPPAFRAEARLTSPLEPMKSPVAWTRDRRNRQLAFAAGVAEDVCDAAGRPGVPMLGRLLFEVLYDFRGSRAFTASLLLNASGFAGLLRQPLLDAVAGGPDVATRRGAADALWRLEVGCSPAEVDVLVTSSDADVVASGLLLGAHCGVPLPSERLDALLRGGEPLTRLALYSAGMTGHPDLHQVSVTADLPDPVRGAARWWLTEGSAVSR